MYVALMAEQKEVYIQWFLPVFKLVELIVPLVVKVYAFEYLVGKGTSGYTSRKERRERVE